MNILVCVKHVPREEDMKLDPVTKTLIRGGEGTISEMDKFALEMAMRLKEKCCGRVTAVSMGLPAAKASLKHALSVGADDAVLLSDRPLGGSDAYATATALAAAARKLEADSGKSFDLILCGKQASDSDTALVSPALAELLERGHTTGAVDFAPTEDGIRIIRETDSGSEVLELSCPAVISVGKTVFPARYPNIRLKLAANRREIPVLGIADLHLNPEEVGVSGSLTDVGSSFVPEHEKKGLMIQEGSPAADAAKLTELLDKARLI